MKVDSETQTEPHHCHDYRKFQNWVVTSIISDRSRPRGNESQRPLLSSFNSIALSGYFKDRQLKFTSIVEKIPMANYASYNHFHRDIRMQSEGSLLVPLADETGKIDLWRFDIMLEADDKSRRKRKRQNMHFEHKYYKYMPPVMYAIWNGMVCTEL